MKTQENIEFLIGRIRTLAKQVRFLRKHRALFDSLPDTGACNEGIDFDHLPHKDVIRVIRALGGKWSKTPTGEDRINYVANIEGTRVRCYLGHPPPNCRVIEVEERIPEKVIPAQVIKRKKLVCHPEFAAAIAVAQEKGLANEQTEKNA